jgi:uncharacterized OB-fold protein
MSKGFEVLGKWEIEYRYATGPFIAKFLEGLKEKKILGIKCTVCRRVLIPPRMFCERCYVLLNLNDIVECKDVGTVQTFFVVYRQFYGLPPPPYAVGLIKPDGADEGLVHFIGEVDLSDPKKVEEKIKIGMKVQAVWNEERKWSILDIKYFKPV